MTKKKKPQQALAVPAKPIRVGRAPGTPVELVTNLYRIPLENRRQIFCYTNIQIEFPVADGQLAGGERVQRRPVVPRKIPKDLCRQAVNNAVAAWMANNDNNDPKVYIFDANSSTMYALFKMLELHNGSLGTRSDLEIRTNIKTTRNAIATRENVLVKFHSPSLVNVRDLIDYCAGKPPRANDQAEQALKALNIILTGEILQAPGFLGMQTKYGSCSVFQDGTKNQFPIGGGIVGERGFNVSVRLTETGPVANIANTVVAFHEPIKITELLQKRFGVQDFSRELSPQIIDGLKKELRMIQVKAIHSSIKYRIHDIGKSALEEKFDLGGETLSVSNYINQRYPNYELLFPNLPCVIDNKGRRIPLELCRIVDKQKVNRKLTGQETREFIQRAALKPETHFAAVEQNAELLCKHDQQSQDFGFKVDKNPIELTGRELPPIKLLAAKDQTLLTEGGGYKCFQAQFIKPAQLKKWALVVLVRRNERQTPNEIKRDCYRFARLYCNSARSKGITCAEFAENDLRCLPINMNDQDMVVKKKLRDEYCFLNNSGYSHAIVVLPKYKDWIYSYLQYLEVDVGNRLDKTRTCTRLSCLKADNFWNKMLGRDEQKEMPMFVSNLLLKHNTKLGGINYVLYDEQKFSIDPKDFQNFLADGYLFVSIDVCHPAPGDRLEQSVAAAVGMWNITSSKMSFCTQVRAQRKERGKEKSTVEEVKEIGIMFKEILESYIKQTSGPAKGAQKLPSHIVVLRDGVSRGQFEMVNSFELPKIKACIKDVYDKLKIKAPLLTCLIIQKRHKVRAKRKKPAKDRKGREDYNIQPGTVIDNEIVDPASLNFYLAPHKAIQGTSRAPHVYMIYDEIKFSQDSAQAMIFALSYLSPRCNKGTSIPTPVNLADLAAERGKHIVVAWNGENPQVMTAEERLKKLNTFLSTMGDANYQNTLYYV